MESNFLYFSYALGLLGMYFGFVGFTNVSKKTFSSWIVQQYAKPYKTFLIHYGTGLLSCLFLGRSHLCQSYLQGMFFLKKMQWDKAMALMLGAPLATGLFYWIIVLATNVQLLPISVGIACLGLLALFIFQSDLYRNHGQRIFYFGILMLCFSWIHDLHLHWSQKMVIDHVWVWIGQNGLHAFGFSLLISMVFQTSFIVSVVAISLLSLDLISFQSGFSILMGGYIGSPMGTMLAYHRAKIEGIWFEVFVVASRFFNMGLSLIWVGWMAQSSLFSEMKPAQLLVIVYLIMQLILLGIILPLRTSIQKLLDELVVDQKSVESDLSPLFTHLPVMCFEIASQEIIALGQKVRKMMFLMCDPFVEEGREAMIQMDELYEWIEKKIRRINYYLSKMNIEELSYEESQRETHWFQISYALKNISNYISRNVMEIASQKKERGIEYVPAYWEKLKNYHQVLLENYDRALLNLKEEDPERLKAILRNQKQLHSMEQEIRQSYMQDLQKQTDLSVEAASNFFSFLSQMQFLNISISRLAYPTVDRRKNR